MPRLDTKPFMHYVRKTRTATSFRHFPITHFKILRKQKLKDDEISLSIWNMEYRPVLNQEKANSSTCDAFIAENIHT